jgi:DNA-3-methyladenine glycosylase II
MFLLHELRRPDVLPAGDTGLRAAIAVLDDPSSIPSAAAAANRAVAWRPYRSYAAGQLSLSIRRHADV